MITPEQSAQLKEYFPVKSHEFLQGKTYISEEAITNRLDEVDPSWSFERLDITVRDTQVIATFRLTVCGVSRDGVGMDSIKQGAGEAEKSAATDALKRAARLFGIGRYILEMGKAVTDYQSLERWLIQRQGGNVSQMDGNAQQALRGNGPSERTIAPKPQNGGSSVNGSKTDLKATSSVLTSEASNGKDAAQPDEPAPVDKTSEANFSTTWSVFRNDLLVALTTPGKKYSYQERANTIEKMHGEGAFNGVSVNAAIPLVLERLANHQKVS